MEGRVEELGLRKALEFGCHEHSFWGSVKNISAVFVLNLLWTMFATLLLVYLTPLKANYIQASIQTLISVQPVIDYCKLSVITVTSGKMLFFLACVLAPLWEEAAFRFVPLEIAKLAEFGITHSKSGYLPTSKCIFPAMILTSIVFGVMHGGVIHIIFQGVGGMLFAWLYIKSGYRASVIAHSLWNFMLMFGMPIVLGMIVKL